MKCNFHDVPGITKAPAPYHAGDTLLKDLDEIDWSAFSSCRVYRREPEDCPFGRGNWMLDLFYTDKNFPAIPNLCIRLPYEWTKEEMDQYMIGFKEAFE